MILRAVLNLKFKNKILFKLEILPGISISLQIDQKAYLQITPIFLRKILSGKHKSDAYSTKYSQAVTHPSTNLAQCCLTSVMWYYIFQCKAIQKFSQDSILCKITK